MPSIYRNDVRYSSVGEYTPAGVIQLYGGTYAPAGWLLCDGSEVSRTDYAALYAAIGITYGDGDGSTTFNIPDLRERFPIGADSLLSLGEMDGSSTHYHDYGIKYGSFYYASNLENNAFGVLDLQTGPDAVKTKTTVPSQAQDRNNALTSGYTSGNYNIFTSMGTTSSGSNMPPYIGLNYIISTGKKIQWNSGSTELPIVRGVLVNGTSVVENGIAEMDDVESKSLLWTNQSPTSTFAAQTINLDLSPYYAIDVVFRHWVNSPSSMVARCIRGEQGMAYCPSESNAATSRRLFSFTDTGVTFADGKYNTYNTDIAVNASGAIPIKIYGVKCAGLT